MTRSRDSLSIADAERIRIGLGDRLTTASHRRDKSKLAAASLFFEHGIYPSAPSVRLITQHGSLTDINEDLRVFWQDLRERAGPSAAIPGIPPDLAGAFGPAIQALWAVALAAADQHLAVDRQAAQDAVQAAQSAAGEDRTRLEESRAQVAQLTMQLEQSRALVLDVEREFAQAREQFSARGARIDQLEQALAAAQSSRSELQALLAEGMDGLRKSTDKASDAFRGEVNFLKMQVDSARSAERDLREQLQAARQGRELELQILRQQNSGLLESIGRLTLANEALTDRLAKQGK